MGLQPCCWSVLFPTFIQQILLTVDKKILSFIRKKEKLYGIFTLCNAVQNHEDGSGQEVQKGLDPTGFAILHTPVRPSPTSFFVGSWAAAGAGGLSCPPPHPPPSSPAAVAPAHAPPLSPPLPPAQTCWQEQHITINKNPSWLEPPAENLTNYEIIKLKYPIGDPALK